MQKESQAITTHAQAIVILGGGSLRMRAPEYGNTHIPENVLMSRVNYAAYVARKTGLPIW